MMITKRIFPMYLLFWKASHVKSFSMSMSSNSGSTLTGKVVAQRFVYRLSPTKSSVTAPYTIEERQYFTVGDDRALEPFGDKCFIIRGPESDDSDVEPPPETLKKNGQPRVYTRIGPSLFKVDNVAEEDEEESLGGSVWDSTYAMILYCMVNPDFVKGKGLELGSGVGIGGLLSTIAAGIASGATESSSSSPGYQTIEEIANSPAQSDDDGNGVPGLDKKFAPVPKTLAKLLLTDSRESLLDKCFTNVNKATFPSAKVEIRYLDWNQRVPNEMKGQYDFIIGCDCAYYFPLVNPLARTVAYTLQTSPYDRVDNEQRIGGQFVHIGPEHRENIQDLRRKLSRGYRMNLRSQSLVLERLDLVPLFLDSMEDVDDQIQKEIESDIAGFVEYQNVETSYFTLLVGYHNEDYDGFNGEFFFPADNGKEDYGGDGKELDFGFSTENY